VVTSRPLTQRKGNNMKAEIITTWDTIAMIIVASIVVGSTGTLAIQFLKAWLYWRFRKAKRESDKEKDFRLPKKSYDWKEDELDE